MPAEIFTRTGTEVANSVKSQFGDPDGRQITNDDILNWINSAQQDIISQNPILKDSAQTNVVSGQDIYTYPSESIQYIEALHYDGVPLEHYTFQEAQTYILSNPDADIVQDVKPSIWYERAGNIYLFPKPLENVTNGLRLFFVRQPANLASLGNTLSVPDKYFQRVIDLVLARAYQLDENWEAAQYKQAEYVNAMNLLANQENVTQVNSYSTNTARIEDL